MVNGVTTQSVTAPILPQEGNGKVNETQKPVDTTTQKVGKEVLANVKTQPESSEKPKLSCCQRFKDLLEKIFCCFCRLFKKSGSKDEVKPSTTAGEDLNKTALIESSKEFIQKNPAPTEKEAEKFTKEVNEIADNAEFQKDAKTFVANLKKDRPEKDLTIKFLEQEIKSWDSQAAAAQSKTAAQPAAKDQGQPAQNARDNKGKENNAQGTAQPTNPNVNNQEQQQQNVQDNKGNKNNSQEDVQSSKSNVNNQEQPTQNAQDNKGNENNGQGTVQSSKPEEKTQGQPTQNAQDNPPPPPPPPAPSPALLQLGGAVPPPPPPPGQKTADKDIQALLGDITKGAKLKKVDPKLLKRADEPVLKAESDAKQSSTSAPANPMMAAMMAQRNAILKKSTAPAQSPKQSTVPAQSPKATDTSNQPQKQNLRPTKQTQKPPAEPQKQGSFNRPQLKSVDSPAKQPGSASTKSQPQSPAPAANTNAPQQ